MLSAANTAPPITVDQRQAIASDAMAAEERATELGWPVYFREIFARGGSIDRHLRRDQVEVYQRMTDFSELHERLADLRSRDRHKQSRSEPEQMLTLRLPVSVHAVLAGEAARAELSIQKWALTKLMLPISDRFVPTEPGRVRGRKPQPHAIDPESPEARKPCQNESNPATTSPTTSANCSRNDAST